MRPTMPRERASVTRKFELGNVTMYATVGLQEDGSIGELFLMCNTMGSIERGLLNAVALMTSLALKHGAPPEKVVKKLMDLKFQPDGLTGNAEFPQASSLLDYLARWMDRRFLHKEKS
jgi:ribonucleoside-diphosphate reductase alpha chain